MPGLFRFPEASEIAPSQNTKPIIRTDALTTQRGNSTHSARLRFRDRNAAVHVVLNLGILRSQWLSL
jgi:hypothetical protein